jgi:hypothetical protein
MITCPVYGVLPKKPTHLLSLNWFRRAHYHNQNKLNNLYQELLTTQVKFLEPINSPVMLHYTYYAKRKGSDVGNVVTLVQKFLEDTLTSHVLKEDNTEHIIGSTQRFGGYDKVNPRVEVHIEPVSFKIAPAFYEPSALSEEIL